MNPSAGNHTASQMSTAGNNHYIFALFLSFSLGISFWPLPKTGHWSRWNFGVTQKRHFFGCDASFHYREQLLWSLSFGRKFTHGEGVNISSNPHPPGTGSKWTCTKDIWTQTASFRPGKRGPWTKAVLSQTLPALCREGIYPSSQTTDEESWGRCYVFSQVLFSMKS